MRRTGKREDVSFARSTYEKAKRFQEGLELLQLEMPLAAARAYLLTGVKDAAISADLYARVDELQAIRKEAINAEMKYVAAQVFCLFDKGLKDESFLIEHSIPTVSSDDKGASASSSEDVGNALQEALESDRSCGSSESKACACLLLGEDVLSGDDIRYGFSSEIYSAAPNLRVYELFMWTTVDEIDGFLNALL